MPRDGHSPLHTSSARSSALYVSHSLDKLVWSQEMNDASVVVERASLPFLQNMASESGLLVQNMASESSLPYC